MQTNIHRKFIKLILKLKRWILCELCPFVFCAGTDKPLTYTRSRSAIFFSPILPKNLLLISNMAHLTIEVFACFYFACHYNLRFPIVSFFRFLSFFFLCILSYLKPWGTLTVDSGWAFNDFSYRIRYHGWLVVLRGKLSHVARWGMIAFCRRKGALKNVNMLTVSKSGRSYIPGKPLSSDLRHIIIDKIIDGGGNPLTMIFPGRFVNLVSVKHASVWACEPLLLSQPCFLLCEYPVSMAGEANSKTLILMLLAPLSNKPFICKLKYFLDKSTRRQFHLPLL